MELISLQGKTNFFEKNVSDYQKLSENINKKDTFNYDDDF